jgi:hypothetical protein
MGFSFGYLLAKLMLVIPHALVVVAVDLLPALFPS